MKIRAGSRTIVISKKNVGFTVLIVIVIFLIWQAIAYNLKLDKIKYYAQQAGLTNVSVHALDNYNLKYFITLQCNNFDETNWDTLMMMDQNICNLHKDIIMTYSQGSFDYYIHQMDNTIITRDGDVKITYNGSWTSRNRINIADEERERQEQNQKIQKKLNEYHDSRISTSKCCICGKQATQRIDVDYYCTEHYNDAYEWYVEKAAKKLVEGQ